MADGRWPMAPALVDAGLPDGATPAGAPAPVPAWPEKEARAAGSSPVVGRLRKGCRAGMD